MKGLQNILILVVVFAVIAVLFSFTWSKKKKTRFTEVNIEISGDRELNFIDQSTIEGLLSHEGNFIRGLIVDSVNIETIEDRVARNPFVSSVEAYTELDGKFNIRLNQRKPMMRVVNGDKGFYVDEDGYSMPLSSKYTPKVIPVTGLTEIDDAYYFNKVSVSKDPVLSAVWELAKKIRGDTFYNAQFIQMDVSSQGEVVLVPRVGNHEINFGKPVDVDAKLEKLTVFYADGIEQSNWNIYKEIDLSFKDQIVCKKR